jgi:hypothetical protein
MIMDGVLVAITLVSLGATGAVLTYAARLIREERMRSTARVAALRADIGPVGRRPPGTGAPTLEDTALSGGRGRWDDVPVRRADREAESHAESGLFQSTSTAETTAARWLVPLIGAAVVVLALGAIYVLSGRSDAGADSARAVVKNPPLELVTLKHARSGDTLTVSGVVRNPADGVERRQVTAVVFLFDRHGSFLASGRAPLDSQALAAGDESPFQITIREARDVSRYRVSFRTGDDMLPHVDRRDAGRPAAGTDKS